MEDHVSWGAYARRQLFSSVTNAARVLAVLVMPCPVRLLKKPKMKYSVLAAEPRTDGRLFATGSNKEACKSLRH